jgi:restriction system protein
MTDTKVTCSKCGTTLDANPQDDNSERKPCPKCGSTTQNIHVAVREAISLKTEIKATVQVVSDVNLLLQTIVIHGEKTSEGRIIEAVSIPWFEIINILKEDPTIAFQISPDKWEEIVAGAYKKSGFDEVILTPRSGDFGRDVIAIKKGIGQIRVIDQVKAYKQDHLVKANDVRALMGVLQTDGASKGFLSTTSNFAPKIKEDPLIVPFIPARLELINGPKLFKRLEELAKVKEL